MMMQMGRHYSLMLSSFLLAGILIAITSNNWFMMWMGLELNLYAFTPFILQTSNHLEKEAALKYFLTQATASIILLTSILFSNYSPAMPTLMFMSLAMKLGVAPCHFWFPSVMNASPWPTCWLLATVQKIAPLTLINYLFCYMNNNLMFSLAALSALVGANGAFNQSHLRPLLAYSSIHHMGWIFAVLKFSSSMAALYFVSYFLISSSIMFFFHKLNLNSLAPSNMNAFNKSYLLSILFNLLSLGGQPPFLGFFPKMMIIFFLTNNQMFLLATILISTSAISLYFYMKIILYTLFSSTSPHPSMFLFMKPSFSILLLILTTSFSTIIFSTIILLSL
uniref:NADH dehydrogenase subunit 2 n=1 Tax=Struwela camposi TaxID=2859449 RepID=UPI0030FE5E4A